MAPNTTTSAAPRPSQLLAPSEARAVRFAPAAWPAPSSCVITTLTPMLMMRNSRKKAPSTLLDSAKAAEAVSDSREASHRPNSATPKPSTSSAISGQASASRRGRAGAALLFKRVAQTDMAADGIAPFRYRQGVGERHARAFVPTGANACHGLEYFALEAVDGEGTFNALDRSVADAQGRGRAFPEVLGHRDHAAFADQAQRIVRDRIEAAAKLQVHVADEAQGGGHRRIDAARRRFHLRDDFVEPGRGAVGQRQRPLRGGEVVHPDVEQRPSRLVRIEVPRTGVEGHVETEAGLDRAQRADAPGRQPLADGLVGGQEACPQRLHQEYAESSRGFGEHARLRQ